jgi:hypothetical protein
MKTIFSLALSALFVLSMNSHAALCDSEEGKDSKS